MAHGEQAAFPTSTTAPGPYGGLSIRQWLAGQAMANPTICSGETADVERHRLFGNANHRPRIQIAAAQAWAYADAVLSEEGRKREP